MKRVVTALIGGTLLLAATFLLPPELFFALWTLVVVGAALEYVRLARRWAEAAPWWVLCVATPLLGLLLSPGLSVAPDPPWSGLVVALVSLAGVWLLAIAVVVSRTPVQEGFVAVGLMSFGLPYLALAIVSVTVLQRYDPWLLVLLFALVWMGDSAAYHVGSALGRHKLAPSISPNKTWEGAAGGLAASVLTGILWSLWRHGEVSASLLGVVATTSVAAQYGDLVESLLKRGVGVKDSGRLLPGHGGLLDRFDALFAAAPLFLVLQLLLGEIRID